MKLSREVKTAILVIGCIVMFIFGFNYLSKKQERKMPVDEYIKINYDKNLSNNENYELISKNIGISRMYFNNIMHTKNIEFDTDWEHQND